MNILYASPEVEPFAKTGGLADVSASLPKALTKLGLSVTVILPFYKSAKEMGLSLTPFTADEFNFLKYKDGLIEYVFVVNDEYYDRDNLYSEPESDYPDNELRFSYFSKAIVAFASCKDSKIDIINLNDWQTGLVPLYLKLRESDIKTVFTIHNIGYQGLFKKDALRKIGIPENFYTSRGIEYYGKVSFLKAGIVYASSITTVSKKYAKEILTPNFGYGMDSILRRRRYDIYGILNGVDYAVWDPISDKYIKENYGPETLHKKIECKIDLIESVKLPKETLERPLVGVISRLAQQKGIDLFLEAAGEIIELGASAVILGTGDDKYNKLTEHAAGLYPKYISSQIKFDNALAHKIEAGSDMFVMPSRYEPCGLNQLYSMRYGTLPVVRATGGLDDTVIDVCAYKNNGNGIKFKSAAKKDLVDAISRAIRLYNDKNGWEKLQKRIMALDFSWEQSARRYKELYEKLLER